MNNDTNLYTKTKELLKNDYNPDVKIIKNTFSTYNSYNPNPNLDTNNNQYSYTNKSNIQINNENILNLNKLINEGKEKIERTLSPLRPEIKKEEISHNEYQINTTMQQLNKIKTEYNMNCLQINNEFIQLKNKKNKLILVYNSLYNFKQKLLNKEKELKKKEFKVHKKEAEIKMKESLIKNKFGSFNNYINYETENLMNKYKNLKEYHQQREDELYKREEKIKEYEVIVKKILESKIERNKEKIQECINLGNSIERKLEKEKGEQIVKDIEIIEKEKENIEKEREILEFEKEKLKKEKMENIKFKKINKNRAKKLKKKENMINNNSKNMIDKYPDYDNNNTFDNFINNNSFFENIYNYKSFNIDNKYNNRKKLLTPIGLSYNSSRYKVPNPYNFKNSKNKKKEESFFNDSIYKNNYSSIRLNEDSISQNYKINNSYVHDNIFLLKNKSNSKSKNFSKLIPIPSNTNSFRNNKIHQKIDNDNSNIISNRTVNLELKNKFNLNTTNESSVLEKEEGNKSKYLEFKSEFDKSYTEINSKIFETEKALQKIENQERKIKIIKDKLGKKMKNPS